MNPRIKNEFRVQQPSLLLPVLLLASIILFSYVVIRSATIELTMDEYYSWKFFAYGPHLYPLQYDATTANDHWLNSWLVQFTSWIFGTHAWAIRLPNVLAYLVYLFYTARWAVSLRKGWFAVPAFLLLNAHPYLLDFFSAARGYGLAFAAISATLFYLKRFSESTDATVLKKILIAAMLALLANFGMLPFYLSTLGLVTFFIWQSDRRNIKQQIQLLLLYVTPLLLIVLPHLFRMQKSGALYYGDTSFWEGSVKSVVVSLLYHVPYAGSNHFSSAKPVIWLLLALLLLCAAIGIRKNGLRMWMHSPEGITFFVFAASTSAIFLEHTLTATEYPLRRVALYLFVLLMFAVVSSLSSLLKNRSLVAVGTAVSIPVLFHLFYCANLGYLVEWKQAGGTQVAANRIIAEHARMSSRDSVTVCTDGVCGCSLQFIRDRDHLDWMKITVNYDARKPKPAGYDFYLVESANVPAFKSADYIVLDTLPYAGNLLAMDPKVRQRQSK